MNAKEFCAAFCDRIALRDVPIGYVFKTPFRKADGDAIELYLRHRTEDNTFRLEDDGETIAYLESNGFDLETETRIEAFTDLLREHDAFLDETDLVIHSAYLTPQAAPAAAVRFSALLLRVMDMLLLSRPRVRSTFRDDLLSMVERQFGKECTIDTNAPLQPSMKDYLVDIVVRSQDGRRLAIYAATSELKALEALLFFKEYREQKLDHVRSMLVLEAAKPRDIKDRTLSRVMNSGILLASMDGEEVAIRQKMEDSFRLS